MRQIKISACLVFLVASGLGLCGDLEPLPHGLQDDTSPRIDAPAIPRQPWTAAGERGALFGRQNGTFEAWVWPVKILSHFRISAELADYAVPIDVNALAATVTVRPLETVITYAHAAFTIRQHAFAARNAATPVVAVFYEIDSARPIRLTFSFTADMLRMWPAPNFGTASGEWVKTGQSGYYVLHTDKPDYLGFVAMPGTEPGIQAPYQERPQTYPLQLQLAFDPKRDAGKVYPLLAGITDGRDVAADLAKLRDGLAVAFENSKTYYDKFFARRTEVETPNHLIDDAVRWAEVSLDQTQVNYHGETGLVAGYYESADSARPGYAWLFGRDTLWTTYGLNSYGDFALSKAALRFLIKRQRADGKIMHEFSQAADLVDWPSTPYFYASADSTPLLVMAVWDYVRASGDLDFLHESWDAVRKAYAFERAHDSDGDGIYENTEGTGWVESWPSGMPHQEIYLAALDAQASHAMSELARLQGDSAGSGAAQQTSRKIADAIAAEYYDKTSGLYAFSRNADGSLDKTVSIYGTVAWWQGDLLLPRADATFQTWASSNISTDWGTRDISRETSFYDPISYHQGSVWPLFTGWASVAEYRAGRSLSGYEHLLQNVRLTWLQDLGAATELLSGDYYEPLGRSSSHQMWSSAMILLPVLRGLFGLGPDALAHTLHVDPHLPATWDHALVRNLRIGDVWADVEFRRVGGELVVEARTAQPSVLCLAGKDDGNHKPCLATAATLRTLRLKLPPVEIALPEQAPSEGSVTKGVKVLTQEYDNHEAQFVLSAPAGMKVDVAVRSNGPKVTSEAGTVNTGHLLVKFPAGSGYEQTTLRFHW